MREHYCFGFQVISSQSECKHQKATVPACSVQQTLFCPVCKRLSFSIRSNTAQLWQPSFCSQSQLVILTSLLTAHTALTPSKHVGMYGKYSFLECHWQSLPANKGTRRQSQALTKPDQRYNILNHSSMALFSNFGLCAVRESKCSIAGNDTVLSRCCEWEPCPAVISCLGWKPCNIWQRVLKGWKDIQTFTVG